MPQDHMDPKLAKVKVLVVDANRHIRQIMRNILNGIGVREIASARDGKTALEELKTFTPHIIFTGYSMDPMGGVELTKVIRAGESPVSATTPIIMVSAHTEITNIIAARDAGISEFLAKPVSSKLIWMRVRSVLEHPRPFVEATNFYGPDRRRREIQRGGFERRKKPYVYTAALRRSTRREKDGGGRV